MENEKMLSARQWNALVRAVEGAGKDLEAIPWPEPGSLAAEYEDAQAALKAAREELGWALEAAPWGANGAAFITRRQSGIGRGDSIVSLWVNRRLRATCVNGWVEVVAPAVAAQQRLDSREAGRQADGEYKESRQELADLLWEQNIRSPQDVGGWVYHEGQQGGCFHLHDSSVWISAPGAMTAAWGPDWESWRPDAAEPFSAEEEEADRCYRE